MLRTLDFIAGLFSFHFFIYTPMIGMLKLEAELE
jgi:hypothetical protein